ncbi:M14 family zinc carboxypeptidase [Aquirufa sp. ROCK-SH2]
MFNNFYQHYHSFQETRIKERRFSDETWQILLAEWKNNPLFQINEIGRTYENRAIHEIKFGIGPIKIAAWSQMHGDEATATMAIADILLFLSQKGDDFEVLRKNLHQKISLHIIPKLNADGASKWQRETALGIDMNRDAQKLHTTEARILSNWADKIKPQFAFNLHDQNRLYSAGNTKHQTHIALLATPGDKAGTWTESRIRAAKLANRLTKQLKPYLENKIAKWTDEYERRAFGDTFQSRGYGLLLIESGGAGWDLEKQSLRKLNACMLLDAFHAIAESKWEEENTELYIQLPTNEKSIVDIKITNAPITADNLQRADLVINLKEKVSKDSKIAFSWTIEDIGDMSHLYGLIEIDGSRFELGKSHKIILEGEYNELIFTEKDKIAFKLTDYTNKINQ